MRVKISDCPAAVSSFLSSQSGKATGDDRKKRSREGDWLGSKVRRPALCVV